ncbi:unnamed protein product [Trichobilharzia regenti]|nr:unnamed protein product [Trichobilharzia regenti]
MVVNRPPFQASEPIKIYMKTLKGIDALGLAQNKYISLKALQFIRRLCRFNPSERLGVGKYGIQEIRSHNLVFRAHDNIVHTVAPVINSRSSSSSIRQYVKSCNLKIEEIAS